MKVGFTQLETYCIIFNNNDLYVNHVCPVRYGIFQMFRSTLLLSIIVPIIGHQLVIAIYE